MRRKALLISTLAAVSLAACQQPAGNDPRPDDPFAPGVSKRSADGVDGLTVGHRLMEAGQYELALKSFLRAASRAGATVEILSSLGSANLRLGRLGQAETLLRRAIKDDPSYAPAWNNLGVVLMEKGETGEAKQVFRTAFALDSGNSDSIRENLRLAIAKSEISAYDEQDNAEFDLEQDSVSTYRLVHLP